MPEVKSTRLQFRAPAMLLAKLGFYLLSDPPGHDHTLAGLPAFSRRCGV